MALWGNTDAQSNAPLIVVRTDGDVATSNTARLGNTQYGNTVFAVSAAEVQAGGEGRKLAHAGWVVKRDRGNGRVQYETLVAMGSIASDGNDDATFPDYTILISTQPVDRTVAAAGNTTFVVAAVTQPVGGTLSYQWQANTGSGFANLIANASITGVDTNTLAINPVEDLGTGASVRVVISVTGGANVTSNTALLTIE